MLMEYPFILTRSYIMAECNTVVEVDYGGSTLTLQSTNITPRTISLEISDEQLKILHNEKNSIVGLQANLKFKCYNGNFEINNNTYTARCVSNVRLSISRFLLVFQFTKLNGSQKRHILNSIARLY